jgi:integrase
MTTKAITIGILHGEIRPLNRRRSAKVSHAEPAAKTISTVIQARTTKAGLYRVSGPGVVGLYLKVAETGAASYFWRYRLDGKRREMGLGSRDRLGLAEAKERVRGLAAQRDKGHDPIEARRQEKAANLAETQARARAARKLTFAQAADAYLNVHGREWKHQYARQGWLNPLVAYAFPVIGDLPLDAITFEHVVAVMKAAEAGETKRTTRPDRASTGRKETARRIRTKIAQVIDAAIVTGQRDPTRGNPAERRLITKAHPSKRRGERAHYRTVELDQAPTIFRSLVQLMAGSTAIAVWAFMIATAARPSEALKARWSEIDLDKALWTIPATRMKAAREHVVPLSSVALAALEPQAKVRTGDSVFSGRGGSPISYTGFARAPADAGIDAGTPHGWRSIFRDWCGDIGDIPRELAEAALAHAVGPTEGSYRRRTAVEKRRPVMQRHADWLVGKEAANVVVFPVKSANEN